MGYRNTFDNVRNMYVWYHQTTFKFQFVYVIFFVWTIDPHKRYEKTEEIGMF